MFKKDNRHSESAVSIRALSEIAHANVWHPFTQASVWKNEQPLIVDRGEGVYLYDVDGREYLDGVSSLWCNVHGHSEPELVSALQDQASKLCHSTLLGLSHRPLLELTQRLISVAPPNISRVFYCDSGTTAVEAGLRIALEWWQKQGSPAAAKRTKLASFVGAYHGDTLGSVNVGYLEDFHKALAPVLTQALRVSPPHVFRFFQGDTEDVAVERSLNELKVLLKKHGEELAAFIVEPLVQGATGIWVHSPAFLAEVARLCREHNVLFIVDEVATGFGKTGTLFAIEQAGIQPDILILGKGLSAGYLPISAALTTEQLFQGFVGEPHELKTFFYGQTYAGNPLAARIGAVSLDLIEERKLIEKVRGRALFLAAELQEKIAPLKHVDEVRQCGLMVGIEFTKEPGKRIAYSADELAGVRVTRAARELGVIIRPLGNVMVLMPALVMEEKELRLLVDVTREAIRSALGDE